jgi:hypothetical protein
MVSAETLVGLAIFFSPSVAALVYAYIKGKGNLADGLSRLLTDVSQVGLLGCTAVLVENLDPSFREGAARLAGTIGAARPQPAHREARLRLQLSPPSMSARLPPAQGYFQPDVGGKNIPVAQGELSDLAGDEPLFKALYKW